MTEHIRNTTAAIAGTKDDATDMMNKDRACAH